MLTNKKNINCNKTPKVKLWQNSKTEIMTNLRNSNKKKIKNIIRDKTQTQMVTKLKCQQNSSSNSNKNQNLNCDKTQKLKCWPNSKTQIVQKPKFLQYLQQTAATGDWMMTAASRKTLLQMAENCCCNDNWTSIFTH